MYTTLVINGYDKKKNTGNLKKIIFSLVFFDLTTAT